MGHLCIFLLVLWSFSLVHAETPHPTQSSTAEMQGEVIPGVEPNDTLLAEYVEAVKRMRSEMGLDEGSHPDQTPSEDEKQKVQDAPFDLKLRVITGTEGILFPLPEQIVVEPTPTPEIYPSETPEPTATPWQPPGSCARSETIKKVLLPGLKDDRIVNDRLFLSEDFMPLDEGGVYGGGVSLYPYGPNQGEGQLLLQKMYIVPCLPYRIRETAWGQYQHLGNDALKSYDATTKGQGVFHPWVEQKLFGPTKKSSRSK